MYIKFVICLESCCLWLHFMWIFTKIFHFFFSNIPPDRNKEIVMKIIMKKKERDFIILVHFFWEKKKIRIAYYFPPFHIFFYDSIQIHHSYRARRYANCQHIGIFHHQHFYDFCINSLGPHVVSGKLIQTKM